VKSERTSLEGAGMDATLPGGGNAEAQLEGGGGGGGGGGEGVGLVRGGGGGGSYQRVLFSGSAPAPSEKAFPCETMFPHVNSPLQ